MAEGRKSKATAEAVRQEYVSVGAALRAARVAKGLEVEDVSASIHVRSVQLKAIEENNIEALPGMTYAVGFVRSYANFLGLNGAEIVHKFKAEHGHSPSPTPLTFPEPIAESRMPDPMMIGVGAFLAVLLLVVWTIYSSMRGSDEVAEQIPPAPVVTSTSEMPAEMTLPVPEIPAVNALTPLSPTVQSMAPELPASKIAAGNEPKKIIDSLPAEEDDTAAPETMPKSTELMAVGTKADQEAVISIKRGKSRITLSAVQASWVQIMDSHQVILYRKVLRPGEQYYVPDQPGLSLVTANAGGLQISVDGQAVAPIGKQGEIVRGIPLDPAALKKQKMRTR